MRTISLEEFHDLLGLAYAVSINDTLYFVGYDTDGDPYTADNDGTTISTCPVSMVTSRSTVTRYSFTSADSLSVS